MRAFLGLLLLLAALAAAGGVLTGEKQSAEFVCVLALFGSGVFFGVLMGNKQ